mmetsp:Transcript_84563/g.205108  ORF Transcript_84563/g.205108 Transcript_84563/m.205108 type:complete len:83 (-) Transcript_84563:271-519(-)
MPGPELLEILPRQHVMRSSLDLLVKPAVSLFTVSTQQALVCHADTLSCFRRCARCSTAAGRSPDPCDAWFLPPQPHQPAGAT